MESGTWRTSPRLPSTLVINVGQAVTVELDSATPYRHHNAHKFQTPPGHARKGLKKAMKHNKHGKF